MRKPRASPTVKNIASPRRQIADKAESQRPSSTSITTHEFAIMSLEVASRIALNGPVLGKTVATAIPAVLATRVVPLTRAAALPVLRAQQQRRQLSITPRPRAQNNSGLLGINNSSNVPSSYFSRPRLPANTIIRFVPQQTAWIVERMGKFNRILEPGLAILVPFLDRIAYVKSLKENAIEIPSQSAITADNVTLELDGISL